MPSGQEIQQYLTGILRVMMGRSDGLKLLDFSADGFWNSFFAIVIALPALVVGWVGIANDMAGLMTFGTRFSLLVRLFFTDIGAWILPLVMLAVAARPAGIADRFVHYVVVTNWANALFAWLLLPPALLRLFLPGAEDLTVLVSLALFLFTLVLSWRLTVAAIGKGPAIGSAVFFAMLVTSVAALLALQALLGLNF
ncbi:transporter [Chelativorans salis]|uniref:Transporter n=1 Tax=Chelativorans salis TaxID=2978478 RepID=A0ABT2LH57_9HYPH|nr:transporter [Chelativorans sp. EGI FJ00035]MCT7373885.1 transporter [Chelativorans sp. EGI FJ00035]